MLSSIEFVNQYFNIPVVALAMFAVVWLAINIIGEFLEFRGKVVPEFMKIRKYFSRKKKERETLAKIPEMMDDVQKLLNDVNEHYSSDNITMRDKWIKEVNESMKKLDKIDKVTLDLLLDSKRSTIIEFANRVSDINIPVTREEFTRIFKLYKEYEEIIEENGRTNGEVEISYRMINEAYWERTRTHTFIEDSRGYNV